jgi:TPR repeat protein
MKFVLLFVSTTLLAQLQTIQREPQMPSAGGGGAPRSTMSPSTGVQIERAETLKIAVAKYNDAMLSLKSGQDIPTALANIRHAAELDHVPAQVTLATLLLQGDALRKNEKQAAIWAKRAARFGSPDGMFLLAKMQAEGTGMQKDLAAAAKNYKRAADAGHALAQFNLATMYESNKLGAPDFAKAAELYRRAAEQGNAAAQWRLASLHSVGQGVQLDAAEAGGWMLLSARAGYAPAEVSWARLQTRLSPDELRKAEEFAAKRTR